LEKDPLRTQATGGWGDIRAVQDTAEKKNLCPCPDHTPVSQCPIQNNDLS